MINREGLAARGFTTVALLDQATVTVLRRRYDELDRAADEGFFASSNDLDREGASAVDRNLKAVLGPALAAVLPGFRPFLASFLVKGGGGGDRISYHQDLSYTDERRGRAVVAWIALDDVDDANGALRLVPGSQRWTTGPRAGGLPVLPTEPFQGALSGQAVTAPVPAGTAVVYDVGIVHGSPPNTGAGPRVAVGVALVPRDVDLVHVHADPSGSLRAFAVDDRYYTRQGLDNLPSGYEEIPLWGRPVDAASIGDSVRTVR